MEVGKTGLDLGIGWVWHWLGNRFGMGRTKRVLDNVGVWGMDCRGMNSCDNEGD